MELSLFQISEEQRRIEAMLEETGGELTPEIEEALAINEGNFMVKARDYGYAILRLKAYAAAAKAEKQRLDVLAKYCEGNVAKMETRLVEAMRQFGHAKVEMDTVRLSLRRSERVVVDDENNLPADCIVVKTEVSKMDVKRHLKAGETIGAHLEENYSLQIK